MAWVSPRNACALALVAMALALISTGALALAGLGHRWGWWGHRVGFGILAGTLAGLALAALLGLVASGLAAWGREWGALVAGLGAAAIAIAAVAAPLALLRAARTVPPIHDITTDTERPPVFVDVLPRRRGAANPADYAGAAIARQQKAAYPDLGPLDLAQPPERAFESAAGAARALGWEIVAEAPAEGRLEATATTAWWGFKDDVVVRVAAAERGSRVDVRSASRVGISDLGANAKRIRLFLAELRERAGR